MPVVVAASFGEHAFRALELMLDQARAADPLAPVTVIVPSNYAGLSLRRELGARGGVVNVRFLVLARVTELLGAPSVTGRAPSSAWRRAEAVAHALAQHTGSFARVAGHAATERALSRVFRELRTAPAGALERLARQSSRAADLVSLYRQYLAMTSGTYDAQDLAARALATLPASTDALRDLGRIILYLPRSLAPADHAFVAALLACDTADIIFGLTGDPAADRETEDLAASLGAAIALSAGATATTATSVIRAADLEEEVRSAVRALLEAASAGTPLHRMAILFPAPETYSPLVEEVLAASETPFNGPPSRPLSATTPGRTLLDLLALPGRDFRREDVTDWLAAAPILEVEGEPGTVPAETWDELARDAGVVRGFDHWDHRVEAFSRRNSTPDYQREAGPRLHAFMRELDARLRLPVSPSLRSLAAWAESLLLRYLGDADTYALNAGPADQAAYDELAATLREMADTASTMPLPGDPLASLVRLLEQAWERPIGRLGPFGQGVFIGSLATARGMSFDRVLVLGMVDGILPPTNRDDPLLTDEERDDAGMAVQQTRRDRARADYLAALATAPERILCYPQSSLRSGEKHLPSRWLLESLAALNGGPVTSAAFETMPAGPWLRTSASFRQSVSSESATPLSLQEWEMRSLALAPSVRRHFLASQAGFAPALNAATERMPRFLRRGAVETATLSPWAGNIGADLRVMESRPFSPTSFEVLAACPYRYLLGNVLRVKETARPSDITRISGADRGTLMHEVLEAFFVEVDRSGHYPGPGEPWSAAHRARLLEIAEQHFHAAYDRGIIGSELLWRIDRARIRRDLTLFLDEDSRVRLERRTTFVRSELAFGMPVDSVEEGEPVEDAPAVLVRVDDTAIAFRGRIDRVDRAEDGSLIVYDYKTGGRRPYEPLRSGKQPMGSGKYLQLPIYALAASGLAESPDVPVEAYYWFTSEAEDFDLVGGRVGPDHLESLQQTLQVLAGLVREGLFPAVSGPESWNFNGKSDGFENCNAFCPYGRICEGGDRDAKWQGRLHAAGLEAFVKMSEIHVEEAK